MKKIFIKTFGCTLNQRDSQDLVEGITIVDSEKKAQIIIINTCGVKEQTENKIYKYLRDNKELFSTKEIIVCGCLVDINDETLKKEVKAKFYKINQKDKLISYLNKYRKNENKKQNTKAIIIANGCLGNCSYCAVKFARGKLKSKSSKDIKTEVTKEIEAGATEILLTAQDTACYGVDINTNISELLKEIIKIPKNFKIRLGMGNPHFFIKHKKEIVNVFKSEKIYKFLHIPLQSGNDRILKLMNRSYTKEQYLEIINYFRKNIKEITIATDVIVGFPTETEKEFQETLDVVKECKFDVVNISRFGQRKKIEANNYPDITGNIKKERSRKMSLLCSKIALENNKKYLNKTLEITITEKGKNNTYIGKTQNYKQVVVFKNAVIGEKYKTKITQIKPGYLISESSA